jgi:hypothetical protein
MAVNLVGDGGADGVVVAPAGSAVGFYGSTPVAIRAANSTLHYASFLSLSSNATIASNVAAFAAEVAATLVGLGIWA